MGKELRCGDCAHAFEFSKNHPNLIGCPVKGAPMNVSLNKLSLTCDSFRLKPVPKDNGGYNWHGMTVPLHPHDCY